MKVNLLPFAVNKALLFLVELLTSYSLGDNDTPDTRTGSPPLRFRDLQAYAHRTLVNSGSLLACLTFCFEFLLEAGGSGNRTASNPIIPRLMQGSPSGRTGIFCLGKLHLACRVLIMSDEG